MSYARGPGWQSQEDRALIEIRYQNPKAPWSRIAALLALQGPRQPPRSEDAVKARYNHALRDGPLELDVLQVSAPILPSRSPH
jgi:hypothetical protein